MNSGERQTSRLEGFSDAVFAFAATLLVVSLEVPKDFASLVSQLYGFAAFAITFGVLVTLWTVHRAFFRRYRLDDGWTVFLNSGLLFVVLFYVFPLKFLTEGFFSGVLGVGRIGVSVEGPQELAAVFMLYSAGFAAVFLFVSLLYWHAWRRRDELGLDELQAWEAAFLGRHYLLFTVTGLGSIALALAGWGIRFGAPGYFYALLGFACYLHGVLSERSKPASRPALSRNTDATA